jgi:hypothetical protein
VTQGYSQSIGCVGRFGQFFQAQLKHHHLLYLLFAAGAVIGDPLFDFPGGIFKKGIRLLAAARIATAWARPTAKADCAFLATKGRPPP